MLAFSICPDQSRYFVFAATCDALFCDFTPKFYISLFAGFIAPVYTKAARKLKMHEIPVIQRKLVYSANQSAGA